MISSFPLPPVPLVPTAHAFLADVAAIPLSTAWAGPAPATGFQAVPFQRRISGPVAVPPTAHALAAEVAATPFRKLPAALGTCARVHLAPFHRNTIASESADVPAEPTAHAGPGDAADTAVRFEPAPWKVGLALGTRFHALPFQRSASVVVRLVPPTAHALVAEVAEIPSRSAPRSPRTLGTICQADPFQRSMRPCSTVLAVDRPTAHAFRGDVAATPNATPGARAAVPRTRVHDTPSQCRISVPVQDQRPARDVRADGPRIAGRGGGDPRQRPGARGRRNENPPPGAAVPAQDHGRLGCRADGKADRPRVRRRGRGDRDQDARRLQRQGGTRVGRARRERAAGPGRR